MAPSRLLRRFGPMALLALAFLFGGLAVGTAWVVARHLREDARETSRLFGRVFSGLADPRADAATGALLDLVGQVRQFGIPIAVTDTSGRVTAMDNAPPGVATDSARLRVWIASLDRINEPIVQPGLGTVHYGGLAVTRLLSNLAVFQAIVLLFLVLLAATAYRIRIQAARDRLWVAMARESAHQMGTPLMSLTGWVAQIKERPDALGPEVANYLQADVERLERVAKRFERIGRPPRREMVGLGAVAERVVAYFRPRLPTRASAVTLVLRAAGPGPTVEGDAVLLEWALEAIVRNALDALSGRGGHIDVRVESSGRTARLVVQDDGPGVAPAVRSQLFEPGVTTKSGGWGIGLALARRIVEQQFGGRIAYRPEAQGSTFVLEFPLPAVAGA